MTCHHVFGLMPWLAYRTLPSAMPHMMPAVCGEMATYCEPLLKGHPVPGGCIRNMAAGPVGCGQLASAIESAQSGQKPVQTARCSVNIMVEEVPSGRFVG